MLNTGIDPVLPLGTGKIRAEGYEVTDRAGVLTGYMMIPGGFVERSVAESPERMDAWMEAAKPGPEQMAAQAAAVAEARAAAEADRAAREARANN